MSKSTAVAVPESTELPAELADLEAELTGQNQSEVDASDIQIPLLKIGQALTQEVQDGDAEAGEFINALTRQGLGDNVEFVVASYQKGRFYHGDKKAGRRARKAYGSRNVPWAEDPFYGKPFTEHPDAEEQYSNRVNAGEIEWGSGPKISTTYDFTGHVISGLEEDEVPIPVCLSLMRTNKRAATKWATILQAVLRGKYWDSVFTLTTDRQQFASGPAYVINVKQGRKTTGDERIRALQLAQVVRAANYEIVGEDEGSSTPKAQPEAEGGLEV